MSSLQQAVDKIGGDTAFRVFLQGLGELQSADQVIVEFGMSGFNIERSGLERASLQTRAHQPDQRDPHGNPGQQDKAGHE
jgi:hypothetical protein